jgi:hypothetical protein
VLFKLSSTLERAQHRGAEDCGLNLSESYIRIRGKFQVHGTAVQKHDQGWVCEKSTGVWGTGVWGTGVRRAQCVGHRCVGHRCVGHRCVGHRCVAAHILTGRSVIMTMLNTREGVEVGLTGRQSGALEVLQLEGHDKE